MTYRCDCGRYFMMSANAYMRKQMCKRCGGHNNWIKGDNR